MAQSPPIKTDLFRFVTFRSPEEFSADEHETRFVTHPNLQSSLILSCPVPEEGQTGTEAFVNYLQTFPQYATKQDLIDMYGDLLEFVLKVSKAKTPIADITLPTDGSISLLVLPAYAQLFEALIARVLGQDYPEVRKAIATLIIVQHAISKKDELANLGITKLTDITIEIPKEVFSCRKPWFFNNCGGSLDGVQSLGVADFRKVEQEVCCYVPGEVSHIENIMAKEYKERSTRNLVRTEDTLETESETTVENLSDLSTTTRNELSTEVASVIDQDQSSNYGGSLGVSGKMLGAQINVNAYADFSNSNSSSYSNSEAETYAEEVTKRALEKIVQRTSQKRTSKIIKEFEENNKHGFDNRGDLAKNVTGVYRWLDILYTNRMVNYGKRLMVEFMVPEPAEFYKTMLKYRETDIKDPESDGPVAPQTLADFGITSSEDITDLNLANAGAYFGVTMPSLPASTLTLTKSLGPKGPIVHNRIVNSQTLTPVVVDPNYEADTVVGSYTYSYRANSSTNSQQAFLNITFGGQTVNSGGDYAWATESKTVTVNLNLTPNIGGAIPVSIGFSGIFGFYGAVTINCVLKQSVITTWQNDAFNALMNAYNTMFDDYTRELAEQEEEEAYTNSLDPEPSDPRMNRILEQRELKRICIEMLMKPYCHTQGKDNNTDQNACDKYQIPQVNQNTQFTSYTRLVKFFEQAIDWNIMSYLFYPYYWADKCDWVDLMQSKSDDVVFQAFLQSGMGRVVVPIRQQFTRAFAFYLESGEIWTNNDLIPGSDSDLYLAVEEEMQTIQGATEKEWETRVPTSLTIIQSKSAILDQEALPCCELSEDGTTTSTIVMSTDVLTLGSNPV